MSCFFEGYSFGLEVGNGGVCAECIPAGDGVGFISGSRLEDHLRGSICWEDRSEQAIGFFWTRRSLSERSEDVVVCNCAMKRLGIKDGERDRSSINLVFKKGACDETDTLLCLQKKLGDRLSCYKRTRWIRIVKTCYMH